MGGLTAAGQRQDWFFTFGARHELLGLPLAARYVRLYGTRAGTRRQMLLTFGQAWCYQYPEESEVTSRRLTELPLAVLLNAIRTAS